MNAWEYGRAVEAKYKPYLDKYYDTIYPNWRDVENVDLQKKLDIDRLVIHQGKKFKVEDKYIEEYCNYDSIFIETVQNTIIGSKGWIYTSEADELVYCFCNSTRIRVFHFDFKRLREYLEKHPHRGLYHKAVQFNTKPEGYLYKLRDFPEDVLIRKGEVYVRSSN